MSPSTHHVYHVPSTVTLQLSREDARLLADALDIAVTRLRELSHYHGTVMHQSGVQGMCEARIAACQRLRAVLLHAL